MRRTRKPILLALVLCLVSLACQATIFGQRLEIGTATPTPSPLPTRTAQPPPRPSPTPVAHVVCFGPAIRQGELRVRQCAGLDCPEAGVLMAGDAVSVAGQTQAGGLTWLKISAPLAGWVSADYICVSVSTNRNVGRRPDQP